MSYIGRQLNNLSDRVKLDSITASATATYNLLLNTVAYVPSSAESLTVSLNGVIQAPQSSYTVSGSQITFASALTSSDSIDFILAERSITLQTPSAGSVGTSQLAADAVNGDKIADDSISDEHLDITAITGQTEKTSLADADKFLISDSAASGALKYVQNSNLGGGQVVKLGQSRSTSSASVISFDNIWDDATYSFYKVYACIDPSTDAAEIRFRWHDSSGELTAAVYRGQTSRQYRDGSSSGTGQSYGYWGQTYATLSWATSSDYYGNAFISMDMFPRTYNEFATRCNYTLSTQDDAGSPQEQNYVGAFLYDANTSLDNGGFRFEVSSGNFQAHDVCIYGFKK